jgi:hypothetical protein
MFLTTQKFTGPRKLSSNEKLVIPTAVVLLNRDRVRGLCPAY